MRSDLFDVMSGTDQMFSVVLVGLFISCFDLLF